MPVAHGTLYDFYPGAPKYWKRSYTTTDTPEVQHTDHAVIITPQFDNLMIYGFSVKSPYEEDAPYEALTFGRGRFPGYCFSVVSPDGEYGTTPLSEVEEITEQEFNEARERGWK